MITADTTDFAMQCQRFGNRLHQRVTQFGGRTSTIIKRQAGLLARTLINLTPPRDRSKLGKKITERVISKFHVMGEDYSGHVWSAPDPAKQSKKFPDTTLYGFTPTAIYGVAKDVDLGDATPEHLYQLFWKRRLTRAGRAMVGRRGKQAIYVWQKITTKGSTVKALAKRLVNHIGRMKAGWSVSWEDCGSPGRALPGWIAKHAGKLNGARGYSVNGLGVPGEPNFTIANTAKGIDPSKAQGYITSAMKIRIKALEADAAFALAHPDKWSEREAVAEAAMEDAA